MKKLTALILAVFLVFSLTLPAYATDAESSDQTDVLDDLAAYYDFEHRSLADIMEQFRLEYGLSENNFAMAYYATGTGDSYGFQVDSYRDAGATYMLPLNIIFYDLEAEDAIDGTKDGKGNYYIGTYYLPYMYNYTITDDDPSMAKTMKDYLGSYREYREALTRFSEQEYTEEYYTENVLNIRYMMNVLWYIYENQETYPDLLGYMKAGYEGWGFDLLLEETHDVAHKYSEEDSVCNDVAIIYTEQPFLLAAYSQNVGHAEEMLGALAELLAEYTAYLTERQALGLPAYVLTETAQSEDAEAETEAVSEAAETTQAAANAALEEEEGPVPVWVLILVIILAVVLAALAYMRGLVKGAEMERKRIRATRKKKQMTK